MPRGIVEKFFAEKGFGFIAQDSGESIFVHQSQIMGDGFRYLVPGEPVEYETEWDDAKARSQAVAVRAPAERLSGHVVDFDHQKGFGFIESEIDGARVFFHFRQILTTNGAKATAEKGERVWYEVEPDGKGKYHAVRVKREDSRPALFRFADMGREENWLSKLAGLAETENWNHRVNPDRQHEHPILRSYLVYTFARLQEEEARTPGRKIVLGKEGNRPFACFNTGLVTENQEEIFALFGGGKQGSVQNWSLEGFYRDSDRQMIGKFEKFPELADYFDDPSVLLYDRRCELYMDFDHIIKDNLSRFPASLRSNAYLATSALRAAHALTQKRVYRNYKTAVPQFHRGRVQLLLPLCLESAGRADLALVVHRNSSDDRQYRGETVLTLDMAYNNARLLCRPDSDWLEP